MKKKTLGMMISSLGKESGMTQLELAEKMGVTDKAVCSNRNPHHHVSLRKSFKSFIFFFDISQIIPKD